MSVEDEGYVDDEEEPLPALRTITNLIIGAAIEVHRSLGPGFIEAIYGKALALEMARRGIRFEPQPTFKVTFKGDVVGSFRLDFLVEGAVIVEIKAVERLAPIHNAQAISYLKATGFRLGLLINFNVPLLRDRLKRVVL